MSNLSGQQINQTYKGLLNLADSTTGITSTRQAVQDGLGNNTGAVMATNYFYTDNIFSSQLFKADYFGVGFSTTHQANVAGTENKITSFIFWDPGVYDYSGITYVVQTATTTSDTVEFSFYTLQYIDGIGIAPYEQVYSATTLTGLTTTGLKTTTLSTPLSFSGYGPGYYSLCVKVTSSGTPTVRLGLSQSSSQLLSLQSNKFGFTKNVAGNVIPSPLKVANNAGTIDYPMHYSGVTSFPTTWSTSDASKYNGTALTIPKWGFCLDTIK